MTRKLCLPLLCLLCCAQLSVASQTAPAGRPSPERPAAKIDLSGDFARLFPARTIVYGEISHLGSLLAQLGGSASLFENYNEYLEIMARGGKSKPLTDREFSSLLDVSGAMGLIAAEDTDPNRRRPAFETGKPGGILRFSTPTVAALMRERVLDTLTQAPPGGHPVHKLLGFDVFTAPDVSYAVIDNHILFGEKEGIRAILETALTRDAKRLGDDPGYGTAVAKLAGGEHQLFIFVTAQTVTSVLDSFFGMTSPPSDEGKPADRQRRAWADAIRSFLGIDAVRGIAVTGHVDPDRATVRFDLEINRTQAGLIPVLADPPVVAFKAAESLPSDVHYMNVMSVDFGRILDLMDRFLIPVESAEPVGRRPMTETIALVETWTGMSVRSDLLPAIGNEIAFVGNSNPFTGALGASGGITVGSVNVIMLEIRDPAIVEQAFAAVMERLRTTEGIPVPKDFAPGEYKGVKLWQLPGMPVSLAVVGSHLVLGAQKDLQQCIDARESGETLAATSDYASSTADWYGDTIFASYFSPKYYEEIRKTRGPLPEDGKVDDEVFRRTLEDTLFDPRSIVTARYSRDSSGVHWEQSIPAKPFIGYYNYMLKQVLVVDPRNRQCWENEGEALGALQSIAAAEAQFKRDNGRFASIAELVERNAISAEVGKSLNDFHGYRIELSASGEGDAARYQAFATPVTYQRTGFQSFFVDETGVVHAADKQGSPAGPDDPSFGQPYVDASPVEEPYEEPYEEVAPPPDGVLQPAEIEEIQTEPVDEEPGESEPPAARPEEPERGANS